MLFEELIKQHRIHRVVAHGVRFALLVTGHQSWIHLYHFFGHESELRDALGVKLVLIAKSHRFEREDNFTGLIHRLHLVFEPLRGNDRAEFTVITNDYSYASGHNCSADASDKSGAVHSCRADTDGVGLISNPSVAYVDIVVADGEICTGSIAQCDVAAPGGVVRKRIKTIDRVEAAGGIVHECIN